MAMGLLLVASTIGAGKAVNVPSDVSQIRALRLENNRAIARHDIPGMGETWSSDIHLICCGNVMFSGAKALTASYQEEEFKNPSFVAYVRIP
ncbi:MAG: hypothetical protein ACRETJ_11165, partial [Steroidobacteraceae bacterium]